MLQRFLYHLFLQGYAALIHIASIRNPKARSWIRGRKDWQGKLKGLMAKWDTEGPDRPPVVWMHCASLGEFEQGRPLIERLKADDASLKVVLSFFSPSGYEVNKDHPLPDVVCYLPMDGPSNAASFLDIIRPDLVLWVKYEYWFYHLREIDKRNIPLLLVSGIFRPDQSFFQWHGGLYRKMLGFFTHLFVQNEASATLAATLVPKERISISGDTRFDRVVRIAEHFEPIAIIDAWVKAYQKVIVAGSTWEDDEVELIHYAKLHPELGFIIAPHNVNAEEIEERLERFPGAMLFSALSSSGIANTAKSNVLIIDNIGMLARLYKYGTITYVGGGFGDDGVHNVLEAAVYGRPVLHGPEYEKYAEAKGLIAIGGAFEFEDALELERILDKLLTDQEMYQRASKAAYTFVHTQGGATDNILDFIHKNRLLTRR